MSHSTVTFSVTADAAWAPGVETRDAWREWAKNGFRISAGTEPPLRAMPAMQRRRVGPLGKMALEVAYNCLDGRTGIPTLFCSRHGEVTRSVELLGDLASSELLSPTSFGLSVHNAIGGTFSIVRGDHTSHAALSARESTVEHAVIEACGLLADGEPAVLLVVYEAPLPALYTRYQDEDEQPFAWAWLIEPPQEQTVSLSWSTSADSQVSEKRGLPAGLEILRFYLSQEQRMTRVCNERTWEWSRHV